MSSNIRYLIPLVVVSVIILFLSSLPNIYDLNQIFTGFDKVIHLIMYFIVGITIQIAVIGFMDIKSLGKNIILIIFAGLIFACCDEIYQSLSPGRFSDLRDLMSDIIGIILSLSLVSKIYRIKSRKKQKQK